MSDVDGPLHVRSGLDIPVDELVLSTSRAGGPGGQNVNKLETRVTLRWNVRDSRVLGDVWRARLLEKLASRLTDAGELIVNASSERSQLSNRQVARKRLAEIVDEALVVPRKRRKTKPTAGSKRRRLAAKKQRSDTKKQRRRPGSDE